MLSMDFDLLSRISQSPNLPRPNDISADTINRCIDKGWIKQSDHSTGASPRYTLQLTPKGSEALLLDKQQAKEKADQDAREEARKHVEDQHYAAAIHRGWLKFALGVFLGWILGGFTPKEVFAAIQSLFG